MGRRRKPPTRVINPTRNPALGQDSNGRRDRDVGSEPAVSALEYLPRDQRGLPRWRGLGDDRASRRAHTFRPHLLVVLLPVDQRSGGACPAYPRLSNGGGFSQCHSGQGQFAVTGRYCGMFDLASSNRATAQNPPCGSDLRFLFSLNILAA